MFFIGATTMPIYAMCIVTAADNSDLPLIQIASGILIMSSLGSILGPMIVAPFMAAMGGEGFFAYGLGGMVLGAVWAFYRIWVIERPWQHEHKFAIMPRTSFVATEMADTDSADPGVDDTADPPAPPYQRG
ncbi:MAG: hypothetical protein U5Q16_02200 [Gammaproteobacteria bacterium]|nr:hypothetical protein [Gammaproteobacteria bacterium]